MKRRVSSLSQYSAFLVALALTLGPALAAAQRGPSTPQERARAVEVTRKLEADPLSKDLQKDREWLLQWAIEIPDISVTICTGPIDPLLNDKKKKKYSPQLVAQYTFGMMAFVIENPDKAKDQLAAQTAGVESILKAYESIIREKPKDNWPALDELVAKRNGGTLGAHMESIMEGCK